MDDLLDLDFAASKPSQPKQTAQSAYGSRSAFDYLAQQQRTLSPSPSPSTLSQPSRTSTPLLPVNPEPKQQLGGGGDAFGDLFGTSQPGGAGAAGGKQLSMQEKLQATRTAGLEAYGGAFSNGGGISPVSSLGGGTTSRATSPLPPSLRASSPLSPSILTPTSVPSRSSTLSPSYAPAAPSASSTTASKKPSDPWDFDLLSSSVPAKSASPAPADDPFDLGFDALPTCSSSRSPAPSSTAPVVADDFDLLSAFSAPAAPSPPPQASSAPPPRATQTGPSSSSSNSPPPHILGSLVEMGFSPSAARSALLSTQNPDNKAWDVEAAVDVLMGGGGSAPSPPSAAAREEPVVDEAERRRREQAKREAEEWGDEEDVKIGRRRSWEFEDDDRGAQQQQLQRERDAAERRKRQQAELAAATSPSASGAAPPSSRRRPAAQEDSRTTGGDDPLADPAAILQQQATAALAQAQKLGFSAFKAAGSFWGQAKEAAVKAVEEQRAAARVAAGLPSAAGGGAATNGEVKGKPKWWREGMDDPDAEEQQQRGGAGKGKSREEAPGFKDSDEEGEDPVLGTRPGSSRPRPQQQQRAPPLPTPAPAPAAAEYRSPFRRGKAAPPPSAAPEGDLLSPSSASAPPPSRSPAPSAAPSRSPAAAPSRSFAPSPSPRQTLTSSRPPISISPSALSTALTHKSFGNAHFKLGRFGDATASYSLALEALPEKWIGGVVVLNNRAQSRLKSGEEKRAGEDCGEVLEILALALPPSGGDDRTLLSLLAAESASLPQPVLELAGAATLDLRDHFGKALGRRAKAFEADEKWKKAAEDWERVLRTGEEVVLRGAGGRKLVSEGAVRCGKMVTGGSSAAPSSGSSSSLAPVAPKPKPRPAAVPSRPPRPVAGSGDAVRALQASVAAAAAEDDLRHSLKDAVEARINAWKGGKESNLRALIASLEEVLWAELGWKKVGMHELISEGGLKVRYVRAIVKVHPDKLNVNNTTVEQRMIAGLVFAALNDAWNANK